MIILHDIYAYVMKLRISEDLTTLTAMVGEGKEITDWCPWAQQVILAGAKLILMDLDGIDQKNNNKSPIVMLNPGLGRSNGRRMRF